MTRYRHTHVVLALAFFGLGVAGCGSDPNLEGAKLDLRNKDYDRALENIAKAVEKDPNNSEALVLKGEILQEVVLMTQNHEERTALVEEMSDSFRRSIEVDPAVREHVHQRMRNAYLVEFNAGVEAYMSARTAGQEKARDAFRASAGLFRNATIVFPDSVNAYVNEASAYYSGGMFVEAVETYEAALGMGHTRRQVYVYLTRVLDLMAQQSADAVVRAQLYRRASRVLETGLQHHEGDIELRDLLLNYFALADEPESAIGFYESQYSEKRRDRVYLYNFGTLLLRAGDYTSAIEKLSEAVVADSGYTKARFNLGAAQVNEGIRAAQVYNTLSDSLEVHRSSMAASTIAQIERRMLSEDTRRRSLFNAAIVQLETARSLAQNAMEEERDICRALFRAYGHIDQRSKADSVARCAEYEAP